MNHGRLRLYQLRERTEAVEAEMVEERARFKALGHKEAPRAVSSFNLFQTPEAIAARMAEALGPRARVLEPSAGLGRLVTAYRATSSAPVVLVEQSPDLCRELYTRGYENTTLIQADFLSTDAVRLGGMFDGVLMNPPFKQGLDIKHIRHALTMLEAGGLLVALCFNGTCQNEQLKPIATTWEVLPEGSFKETGTRASVAMLTIRA